MSVEIVFETHSRTEDNERGIGTGWDPGRLSARGRELARELGERRRSSGLVAVFVSDLARAVETADIAFADSDLPRFLDWRLRECNYGEWNGKPLQLFRERGPRIDEPFPGGESWRQALARVDECLDDIVRLYADRTVLVIGHAATRWALDRRVHGRALAELVAAPFDWQEGWRYVLG